MPNDTSAKPRPWDEYLSQRNSQARIAWLQNQAQQNQGLPISLAQNLLDMDLSTAEKAAIVSATCSSNPIALEDFFSRHIDRWHQDVAVNALRTWASKCDGLLWFRLLRLNHAAHLSQRVRYTVLDLAPKLGGRALVKSFCESDDINDWSSAFQALLFQRALEWSISQTQLIKLARSTIDICLTEIHPQHKALLPAIFYLKRFAPENLDLSFTQDGDLLLQDAISSIRQRKATKAPGKKPMSSLESWPQLADRHKWDTESLSQHLQDAKAKKLRWTHFSGIESEVLSNALLKLATDENFLYAYSTCSIMIDADDHKELLSKVKTYISESKDPADALNQLPLKIRIHLNEHSSKSEKKKSLFTEVLEEERRVLAGNAPNENTLKDWTNYKVGHHDFDAFQEEPSIREARDQFFSTCVTVSHRPSFVEPRNGIGANSQESYWSLLSKAWESKNPKSLDSLASLARKQPAVYQLCYIQTLGQFAGHDEAVLKLLDFIHSEHEDELRYVFQSLRSIATPRSFQEMIHAISRSNSNHKLQNEIAQLLKDADLSNLQSDLRSAIDDLKLQPNTSSPRWELYDTLEGLLQSPQISQINQSQLQSEPVYAQANIDSQLKKMIPGFESLSTEVRKALRTALFFHQQVQQQGTKDSIDLSPVIDMQYKALELCFRELFEDLVTKNLAKGNIPRKLDLIGYARPIPQKMDEFESYLESLPIIQKIPFFSKFKLRKLLRSLCQYQPGRRFTLDGLKAFSLFFLCFSRQNCRFGLSQLVPLPVANDTDLFNFVSELHILQDMRNRAAHEGFQPSARNDIQAIWQSTARIFETALYLKAHMGHVDSGVNRLPQAG